MKRYRRRAMRWENKKIALERITLLLKKAREVVSLEPAQAQRYVNLARKIGMRHKVRIPGADKRTICKYCNAMVIPGKSCRVRIRQKREAHIVVTCFNCGKHMRIPLKNKSEASTKKESQKPLYLTM